MAQRSVKFVGALLALMLAVAPAASAQSAGPVAANAFITYLGLNWAWANPCRMSGSSCDGSYSFQDGFRFATATEWTNRPAITAFLDAAGNFAGSGGQMRCASAWFSSIWVNCDYTDAVNGYFGSGAGEFVLDNPNRETWLVRGDPGTPNGVVPEPATMSLLATGLVALAAAQVIPTS